MSSAALRQESLRRVTSNRSFRTLNVERKESSSSVDAPRTLWQIWRSDYLHHSLRLCGCVIFYVVCVWFYSAQLGWNIVDCVYFITVSITTVGYGDMTPETNTQRIFTIIMLFVGMIAVFSTINDFATYIISSAEKKALEQFDDDEVYDQRAKYALRIFLSILCILVCLMVGTVFFIYNEEWDFVQSLYFSVVTTVSVGYGDRELTKQSSRMFLIFYIIISVIVVAGAIGNFGSIKMEMAFEERKLAMLKKEFDMDALMQMDANGDGVDEIEFLAAMLVQMHGLDMEKDIKPWLKRFRELDADSSGRLDMKDLQLFARQQKLALKNKLRRFSNRDLVSFCSELSDEDQEDDDGVESRGSRGPESGGGGEGGANDDVLREGDVELRRADGTTNA